MKLSPYLVHKNHSQLIKELNQGWWEAQQSHLQPSVWPGTHIVEDENSPKLSSEGLTAAIAHVCEHIEKQQQQQKSKHKLGVVVHVFNPSSWEAGAEGSLWIQRQSGLHSEGSQV